MTWGGHPVPFDKNKRAGEINIRKDESVNISSANRSSSSTRAVEQLLLLKNLFFFFRLLFRLLSVFPLLFISLLSMYIPSDILYSVGPFSLFLFFSFGWGPQFSTRQTHTQKIHFHLVPRESPFSYYIPV